MAAAGTGTTPNNLASGTGTPTTLTPTQYSLMSAASGGLGDGLVFPLDLQNYNNYMALEFYNYSMPSFYTGNASAGSTTKLGGIYLPMPNYMVDNQLVVYDQESLSLALGAGLNSYNSGGGFWGTTGAAAGAAVGQGMYNIGKTLAADADLSQNTPDALMQTQGYTINPFMTVMFKTPAYKKHSLSWKLSPKNAQESQVLNSIIDYIKLNELPNSAYGGTLLTYPNIVKISVTNSPTPYFSYLFKPAVIESCAANYAPAGQPSFFTQTNAPGEVEIALSVLEIEFWLKSDFNGGSTASTPTFNAIINSVAPPYDPSTQSYVPTPVLGGT